MWGIGLLLLLCGTGIYFTIRLRFIQVRRFGEGIRLVFGHIKGHSGGEEAWRNDSVPVYGDSHRGTGRYR